MVLTASRYNFWSTTDRGAHLLYNGITGAMLELDADERQRVADVLGGATEVDAEVVATVLVEHGFLVDASHDEVAELLDRNERTCADHDVLDLMVAPTYQCNFRCRYCYVDFEPARMSSEVANRVRRFVEGELSRRRQTNLTWFGGEPLLCPHTVVDVTRRLLATADQTGTTLLVFLTTNGYLLTPAMADDLVAAGIELFHVTIDGSADHHDCQRVLAGGRPTFDRILQNCLDLLDRHPSARLTLRMNVDDVSVSSAETVLEAVPSEHRSRVQVHVTPILWGTSHRPSTQLLRDINRLLAVALRMGFVYYDNLIRPGRPTFCSADRRGNFQIGPDGRVHKCSPSGKPEVQVGALTAAGVPVLSERFDAWHSLPPTKAACPTCPFLCFCGGGCRLDRARGVGDATCRDRFGDLEQIIRNRWLASTCSSAPVADGPRPAP